MTAMPISHVFFGTPEFALPILDALERAGRMPLAVVCQPDRPKGRGLAHTPPPVKQWAKARTLPVFQPEKLKDPDFLEHLRRANPDIALVAAFGQLIPQSVLEQPRFGFINVHPSLLPRYRGAAPIQWTLINGDAVTGVTILQVTPRLDDGDIIVQESQSLSSETIAQELHDRLAHLGGRLAVQALELYERGHITPQPQDHSHVVWARALQKEDGRIDWGASTMSIHNLVRGVQPWPGAFTQLNGKLFKIHRAAPAALIPVGVAGAGSEPSSGTVWVDGERLLVRTSDGWLQLLEVQLEGKKRMDAKTFIVGRTIRNGDRFDGKGS
jgi:methionyl-tRNA formyltransferase